MIKLYKASRARRSEHRNIKLIASMALKKRFFFFVLYFNSQQEVSLPRLIHHHHHYLPPSPEKDHMQFLDWLAAFHSLFNEEEPTRCAVFGTHFAFTNLALNIQKLTHPPTPGKKIHILCMNLRKTRGQACRFYLCK